MSATVANERASRTQFGLKSLLLIMTAAAAVLAPTYWFGPGFLIPFLCSMVLLSVCVRGYSSESSAAAIGVAFLGLIVGFLFAIASMVFFVHSFWNVIICVAFAAAHARPKVFAAALGSVIVVVYGCAACIGTLELFEVRSAKARYPFESLEPRLAFEKGTALNNLRAQDPIQLASAVATHLDEQDERRDRRYYRRKWALEQLHERTYHDFVFASGFGVSRMPRFRPQMVELNPPPKFTLPRAIGIASSNAGPTELYGVHRSAVSDFVAPDRIGYVRSRTEVAGFNSHVITNLDDEWSNDREINRKWQVVRLELVSLLRHSEPRVYVATTMPPMDQLAADPHRALNEFEKGALQSLVSQEDVVVDQQPERIEMLGAVRAGTTCLECHDVHRGKLLGAFSYEITPLLATEKTTASIK